MITPAEHGAADTWPFSPFHGLKIWTPSQGVDVLKGGDPKQPDTYAATSTSSSTSARSWSVGTARTPLYGGGLRIYTTLDSDMQRAAFDAVTGTLEPAGRSRGRAGRDRRAGPGQGDDGRPRLQRRGRVAKVNLATGRAGGGPGGSRARRSRPFALAEAIREGYSVDSVVRVAVGDHLPATRNDGDDWTVKGGCCGGRTTLAEATEKSVNTVYAQLMVKLGAERSSAWRNGLGVSADSSRTYSARARAPRRCRCSTWPPRTRPSPTRVCASRPGWSCGSSGPTAPWWTTSRPNARRC